MTTQTTTQIWHELPESELNDRLHDAANKTLTLCVDHSGNFIYSDMGANENWEAFCKLAGIEI